MESLVNKAIRSIATQVAAGLGQAFTLESLPVEMAERVVRELQARNHLNDSTLQTVAGPHLTTLDLYNTFNDSSISSEAIEAALRVRPRSSSCSPAQRDPSVNPLYKLEHFSLAVTASFPSFSYQKFWAELSASLVQTANPRFSFRRVVMYFRAPTKQVNLTR
jgi:hypothetical protein